MPRKKERWGKKFLLKTKKRFAEEYAKGTLGNLLTKTGYALGVSLADSPLESHRLFGSFIVMVSGGRDIGSWTTEKSRKKKVENEIALNGIKTGKEELLNTLLDGGSQLNKELRVKEGQIRDLLVEGRMRNGKRVMVSDETIKNHIKKHFLLYKFLTMDHAKAREFKLDHIDQSIVPLVLQFSKDFLSKDEHEHLTPDMADELKALHVLNLKIMNKKKKEKIKLPKLRDLDPHDLVKSPTEGYSTAKRRFRGVKLHPNVEKYFDNVVLDTDKEVLSHAIAKARFYYFHKEEKSASERPLVYGSQEFKKQYDTAKIFASEGLSDSQKQFFESAVDAVTNGEKIPDLPSSLNDSQVKEVMKKVFQVHSAIKKGLGVSDTDFVKLMKKTMSNEIEPEDFIDLMTNVVGINKEHKKLLKLLPDLIGKPKD